MSRESNSTAELTDVNVCRVVQYIQTSAPELQLIECALLHVTMIFLLKKQILETFFIVHNQKSSYRTPLPSAEIADRGHRTARALYRRTSKGQGRGSRHCIYIYIYIFFFFFFFFFTFVSYTLKTNSYCVYISLCIIYSK